MFVTIWVSRKMWRFKGLSPTRLIISMLICIASHEVAADTGKCSVDQDCLEHFYCLNGQCVTNCISCDEFNREGSLLFRRCALYLDECGPCKPGYSVSEGSVSSSWCSPNETSTVESAQSAPYLIYCFVALLLVILLTALVDLVRKFRQASVDRKQRERVREEGEGTYRRIDDHGDFLVDEERESFIFVIEDDQLSTLVDDVDSYSKASTLPDDDLNWRRNLVNFYENKSGILYNYFDISTNSRTNVQSHLSGSHME